jgi:hypothetical protein
MRKILLAASAIAGFAAVTAGNANAQMPNQPVVDTGFGSQVGNPVGFPAPGTVVVRIKGILDTLAGVTNDSGTVAKSATGVATGNKTGAVEFMSYGQIQVAFDGVSANGMQYGATLNLRQNAVASGSAAASTAYYIRQGGYVGSPTLGKVWFGPIDGAAERFLTGTFENFDVVGNWNAITTPNFVNGNAQISWNFPEDSIFYKTEKLTYLSPSFAGFDFGLTFEPNVDGSGLGNCGQASATLGSSTGCPNIATTAQGTVVATTQRKNLVDGALRYKGSFGPVAVVATGIYMVSGAVGDSTALSTTAKAKGLSVYNFGATATVAGLTFGGTYTGGTMNNNFSLIRSGEKKSNNFILGASYTIGTVVVGANYINELSAGNAIFNTNGSIANGNNLLHEIGISVGGSWDYAPGAALFVTGIYGTRHQAGFDLQNAVAGKFNNSTRADALTIGNRFNF